MKVSEKNVQKTVELPPDNVVEMPTNIPAITISSYSG
jgi:hypothetical protein